MKIGENVTHGVEKIWLKFHDLRMDRSGDINFFPPPLSAGQLQNFLESLLSFSFSYDLLSLYYINKYMYILSFSGVNASPWMVYFTFVLVAS